MNQSDDVTTKWCPFSRENRVAMNMVDYMPDINSCCFSYYCVAWSSDEERCLFIPVPASKMKVSSGEIEKFLSSTCDLLQLMRIK